MEYFDPKQRAIQKQQSREKDAADLNDGVRSAEQIQEDNSFIPSSILRSADIDFSSKTVIDHFYVGKKNRKMGVLRNNEFFYCIPNYLKITSRKDLQPLADEANATGTISIQTIMAFEYSCKRK